MGKVMGRWAGSLRRELVGGTPIQHGSKGKVVSQHRQMKKRLSVLEGTRSRVRSQRQL